MIIFMKEKVINYDRKRNLKNKIWFTENGCFNVVLDWSYVSPSVEEVNYNVASVVYKY